MRVMLDTNVLASAIAGASVTTSAPRSGSVKRYIDDANFRCAVVMRGLLPRGTDMPTGTSGQEAVRTRVRESHM